MASQIDNDPMVKRAVIAVVGTILAAAIVSSFGVVYSRVDKGIEKNAIKNMEQDSSIARLNVQTALDRQSAHQQFGKIDDKLNNIMKTNELILHKLRVPEYLWPTPPKDTARSGDDE